MSGNVGKRGNLFTISGPSGSGKTSLCAALLEKMSGLRLSISCTTRPRRPAEVDGRDYYFLDPDRFQELIDRGAFLEHAVVHGYQYGTRLEDVEAMLANGEDVLLEIDWQGAAQVAGKKPDVCRIFILPPSLVALRQRIESRGQDSPGVIRRRVNAARKEILHANEAEFRIVNHIFGEAVEDLISVVRAHRLRAPVNVDHY